MQEKEGGTREELKLSLPLYAQQERKMQQLSKTMLDDMDPKVQLSVKYPRVLKK